MKWEKVKLGEITESCLGKMLDQNKNKGTYQKYLANVNVRWGSFDLENLSEMRFEDDEAERYGVRYGDLIVCEGGEPGRCAIWKNEIPNMKIQKALHRVRVLPEKADAFYLLYWFIYAGQKKALDQYFTGATIKHMPGDKLKQVVIDLPDLPTQRRIASILSAYDDLIENNRRQIKLLEEAAQRLYREWFVELRFPGHEDVKIVDGVPEGWNIGRITSFYSIRYGKNLPMSQILESGLYPVYGANGIIGYHNQKNVDCLVTLITSRGNGSGNVSRTYAMEAFITNNSFWAIPLLQSEGLPFCHQLLLHTDFKKVCSGSAQPQLTYTAIDAIMVLHPEEKLIRDFCTLVDPTYVKINLLFQQISLLEMARDRLLPKLMSGEMEVSLQ